MTTATATTTKVSVAQRRLRDGGLTCRPGPGLAGGASCGGASTSMGSSITRGPPRPDVASCQTPRVDSKAHKAATRIAYERLAEVWADTDDNLWNEALERSAVRRLLPQPLAEARRLLSA